jgi:TM2 domain-containing membrane protein YozV
MQMEKKILAAILSFLMPGLGHFYSRRWARGIIVFFIYYIIAIIISEFSIYLIPSNISDFPFIHIIIGFIVAWDAYKVAPNGRIMFWQKMIFASLILLLLAVLCLKSDNLILALIFIIASAYIARIVYENSPYTTE